MTPPADSAHALDPETIELGKQQLAKLRAEFGLPTTRPLPRSEPEPRPPREPAPESVEPDEAYTERLIAGMSAAAERDRLEARVAQLETEVAQLRRALASILHTAAGAVTPADDSEQAGPPRTERPVT